MIVIELTKQMRQALGVSLGEYVTTMRSEVGASVSNNIPGSCPVFLPPMKVVRAKREMVQYLNAEQTAVMKCPRTWLVGEGSEGRWHHAIDFTKLQRTLDTSPEVPAHNVAIGRILGRVLGG